MTGPTDPTTPGEATHPDELLAGYVDGSLEPAQREEAERHLAGCATCQDELALCRRARAGLGGLSELEVPAGVTRPMVEGLRRRGGSRRARITVGGSSHRSSRVARVAWSVGTAAAAAVIGVFAWSALHGGGSPIQPAAAPQKGVASVGPGAESVPSVAVTRQSIDYDAASIQTLASRVAKTSRKFDRAVVPPGKSPSGGTAPAAPLNPSPPGPATLGSATEPAPSPSPVPASPPASALPCLESAAGSSSTPGLVQVIRARFEGTPAYIGVYAASSKPGRPADLITVWVVSASDCSLLNYTSSVIP
ncbi:MAG: zf-HC2 domain-containing protein [Actinomycetota bacterium]|nr:zf-HC2 domain-containing protein [Actinomycetota bacterium]